jgi:hypothetical protein
MPEATSERIKILIVDNEKSLADILKDIISDKDRSWNAILVR